MIAYDRKKWRAITVFRLPKLAVLFPAGTSHATALQRKGGETLYRYPMQFTVFVGMSSRCYYSVTYIFWCLAMTATTTLKLPEKLKIRITRLAKETGRSAHSLMIEALEREVAREERLREFVREALVSDTAVEEGAAIYRAEDVHPWLERLAKNRRAARPKPWRK